MDFLLRQAKRCNRNLYITSMIILAIAVLISFFPLRDYYLSFEPDKELDVQKVNAKEYGLGLLSDFYYIDSDEFIDLGTQPYIKEVKLGDEIKEIESDDYYILVKSGEYWLPVCVSDNIRQKDSRYQGKLSGINDRVLEELKSRAVKLCGEAFNTNMILGSRLDTTIKSTPWTNIFFWISLVLFLIFLTNIIKFIKRASDPYKSPVFSNLAIYGNIEEIEQSINREMQSEEFSIFENVIITDNWFLSKCRYTVDIVPLCRIVWVYTKTEWKRWKGIIPLYKVTKLNVVISDELCYEAVFRLKAKADDIVDKLKKMLPWILVGYSKETKKLFDSDYDNLVRQIDNYKTFYRKI